MLITDTKYIFQFGFKSSITHVSLQFLNKQVNTKHNKYSHIIFIYVMHYHYQL